MFKPFCAARRRADAVRPQAPLPQQERTAERRERSWNRPSGVTRPEAVQEHQTGKGHPGESGIGLRVVPLHGREGQPSL